MSYNPLYISGDLPRSLTGSYFFYFFVNARIPSLSTLIAIPAFKLIGNYNQVMKIPLFLNDPFT